jgi:ectoine hydroxylase-related dioxygenase (phytanoyl-CoA dioxygenase family)
MGMNQALNLSQLPDLQTEYPLNRRQIDSYQRDGHIFLRGVASKEEVAAYRPIITEVLKSVVESKDSQGRVDDYSSLFLQVTNVWRMSEALKRFVFARRFAKIAAELMGVDGVRLYHDQVLFKPPGGKQTPWHQDQYYWPLDTENTITMWMPLVDVPKEMGPMMFAAGSHKLGYLGDRPISEDAHEYFASIIGEKGFDSVNYELEAGDATFHSGLLLHSAHPNTTDQTREVITIIYYADGARILEPDNRNRKADMEAFHPGQKPGEVAASPLNPLL